MKDFKVARFAYGEYGKPFYEGFSFRENNGRPSEVLYRYCEKEINLHYLGTTTFNGKKAFKVAFPNKLQLYVIPNSNGTITVVDRTKKYNKVFDWEYEGPVNGIGTFCEPCVEEKDAIPFLRKYYLK